jgi:hypothetical protein
MLEGDALAPARRPAGLGGGEFRLAFVELQNTVSAHHLLQAGAATRLAISCAASRISALCALMLASIFPGQPARQKRSNHGAMDGR